MIQSAVKDPIPNPVLKDFWAERARFRILYGGRDSTKSWDAAIRAVWIAKEAKVRVLCTRMYQNRIEESVYALLKKQINRFQLDNYYKILHNKIISSTGSEFIFYGLARNISEIKSLEGIDILLLEEAQSLTKEIWEVVEPTIRKQGSEIWVILNPRVEEDFAYQRFVVDPPENSIVRKINYDENPFLSETSKETIDRIKQEDYDAYEHIYLGVPRKDDQTVIIKRSWIEAATDAHVKLNINILGQSAIGYDPADSGDDKNAISIRKGILTLNTEQWFGGENELMKSSKRVYEEAIKKRSEIIYDSIGVGAGCGSKFAEINEDRKIYIGFYAFNAAGKVKKPEQEYEHQVKNKDYFSNLKAQAWWLVANKFKNTYNAVIKNDLSNIDNIISISSNCNNIEKLISQLCTPRKDYDSSGRIKVESKKDMLKRGVKSPNLADAFIMSNIIELVKQEPWLMWV